MAVFHKKSEPIDFISPQGTEKLYKLVIQQKYPYKIDSRTDEEKILDNAKYYIRFFSSGSTDYNEELPLKLITKSLHNLRVSEETIKEVLEQDGWIIRDREHIGLVIQIPTSQWSDGDSLFEGEDFLDFEPGTENDDYELGLPVCYNRDNENWDEEDDGEVSTRAMNGSAMPGEAEPIPSMCSMFLEPSREGTMGELPSDVATNEVSDQDSLSMTNGIAISPRFTSSPWVKNPNDAKEDRKSGTSKKLSLDPDTPPNSFSPDVADSGYPASGPDLSPDLPSIEDDVDSDSSSDAEALQPEAMEVKE